jgi:hypothetical protein
VPKHHAMKGNEEHPGDTVSVLGPIHTEHMSCVDKGKCFSH